VYYGPWEALLFTEFAIGSVKDDEAAFFNEACALRANSASVSVSGTTVVLRLIQELAANLAMVKDG